MCRLHQRLLFLHCSCYTSLVVKQNSFVTYHYITTRTLVKQACQPNVCALPIILRKYPHFLHLSCNRLFTIKLPKNLFPSVPPLPFLSHFLRSLLVRPFRKARIYPSPVNHTFTSRGVSLPDLLHTPLRLFLRRLAYVLDECFSQTKRPSHSSAGRVQKGGQWDFQSKR